MQKLGERERKKNGYFIWSHTKDIKVKLEKAILKMKPYKERREEFARWLRGCMALVERIYIVQQVLCSTVAT